MSLKSLAQVFVPYLLHNTTEMKLENKKFEIKFIMKLFQTLFDQNVKEEEEEEEER